MLPVIVLPSFPVVVPDPKTIVPNVATVFDPLIVQLRTVSLVASLANWIVTAVAATEVFSIVKPFVPSITTLSAPFKLINAPAIAPDTVHVDVDEIVRDVHELTDG